MKLSRGSIVFTYRPGSCWIPGDIGGWLSDADCSHKHTMLSELLLTRQSINHYICSQTCRRVAAEMQPANGLERALYSDQQIVTERRDCTTAYSKSSGSLEQTLTTCEVSRMWLVVGHRVNCSTLRNSIINQSVTVAWRTFMVTPFSTAIVYSKSPASAANIWSTISTID